MKLSLFLLLVGVVWMASAHLPIINVENVNGVKHVQLPETDNETKDEQVGSDNPEKVVVQVSCDRYCIRKRLGPFIKFAPPACTDFHGKESSYCGTCRNEKQCNAHFIYVDVGK